MLTIKQIIDEFPTPCVYIVGDFNVNFSQNSKFGEELMCLCNRCSLYITDKKLLPSDTSTHVSMAHGSTSWLDHCITTMSGQQLVQSVHMFNDFVTSDHIPLSVCIKTQNLHIYPITSDTKSDNKYYKWVNATEYDIKQYKNITSKLLGKITIPVDAILCSVPHCSSHNVEIDNFYTSIVEILNSCFQKCIPCYNVSSRFNIPGWNDHVKESHDAAREAFLWWQCHNNLVTVLCTIMW